MIRTQKWCDTCGKAISDSRVPKGFSDFNNINNAWEFWSPNDDHDGLYCSLPCLITGAQQLYEKLVSMEQPLDEHPFESGVMDV